jgi:ribose-phosphate pyrophosphokinase
MIKINNTIFADQSFHNEEKIYEADVSILNPDRNTIQLIFQDNRDITDMLFARNWITDKQPKSVCNLEMLYIPYERMDREIHNQLFSMKYFAEIIKTCNFDTIKVLDAHSHVSKDFLKEVCNNLVEVNLADYVEVVKSIENIDLICYPDKGAYSKYPSVIQESGESIAMINYMYGNKVRDLANKGQIVDYELMGALSDDDYKGKNVLIIDDICCLGGTAYNCAKALKAKGVNKVIFYISHCENGIYYGNILKDNTIDRVYTANTMGIEIKSDKIVVVESASN